VLDVADAVGAVGCPAARRSMSVAGVAIAFMT
jgi:hypothetical protein